MAEALHASLPHLNASHTTMGSMFVSSRDRQHETVRGMKAAKVNHVKFPLYNRREKVRRVIAAVGYPSNMKLLVS
jgi:hypothetical protein